MKKVSIIIPAYNYDQYVAEAVESALAQTLPECEVVVINDGSTDNTEKALGPYMDRIVYVKQENKGLPSARNAGVNIASGELVCFLDADDTIFPEKAEVQASMLEQDPSLEWVYSDALVEDLHGHDERYSDLFQAQYAEAAKGRAFKSFLKGNFVPINSPMLRREVVLENPFDPELLAYEDLDFWLRVSKRYRSAYIDRPLCTIRKHGGGMQKDREKLLFYGVIVAENLLKTELTKDEMILARKLAVNLYVQYGDELNRTGNIAEAQKAYNRALRYNPISRYTLLKLIGSFFRKK